MNFILPGWNEINRKWKSVREICYHELQKRVVAIKSRDYYPIP